MNKKQVTLHLSEEVYEALRLEAFMTKTSQSTIAEEAIKKELEKRKKDGNKE